MAKRPSRKCQSESPQCKEETLFFTDFFDDDKDETWSSKKSKTQKRMEDDWSSDDSFEGYIEDEEYGDEVPYPYPRTSGDYPGNESSTSDTRAEHLIPTPFLVSPDSESTDLPSDPSSISGDNPVGISTVSKTILQDKAILPTLSSSELSNSDDEAAHPSMTPSQRVSFKRSLPPPDSDDDSKPTSAPPSWGGKLSGRLSPHNDVQDHVLRWKGVDEADQNPNQLPPFIPHRTPGPQLPTQTTPYSILDIFMLYFPRDLLGDICQRMKDYTVKRKASGEIKYSLPNNFGPDMFYSFLACLYYMGLVRTPETRDYFSNSLIGQPFLKNNPLSGNDFHFILWAFHCTTLKEDEEIREKRRKHEPWDKLSKIRLLYDSIRQSCYKYRAPSKVVSVDERTVAYKTKQYTKDKSTKLGIKLWVISCPKTGYTHDFEIYPGKVHGQKDETGLAHSVVQNLMQPYMNCGHRVFIDSYYTSQALYQDFLTQKTPCIGTVRESHRGFPKNASNALNNSSAQGEIRWLRRGPVCYVQWKDAQVINMASTCHLGNATTSIFRIVTAETGSKIHQHITVPQCIYDYKRSMEGVDLSDQKIETYSFLSRTSKWYRKLLFHFLDLAEINSLVIYNEMQEGLGKPIMSHKKGRMELICLLQSMYIRSRASPNTTSVPLTTVQLLSHMSEWRSVRGTCRLCQMLNPKAPPRRTFHFCRACDVALCNMSDRNCYTGYHDNYAEPQ